MEKVLGACAIEAWMVMLGHDWVKQRLQKALLTLPSPLILSSVVLKCVYVYIYKMRKDSNMKGKVRFSDLTAPAIFSDLIS